MTSAKLAIGHQFARLRPGPLGRRDVARAILRLPGEALAHRVPDDLVAEPRERVALGRMPRALDELHHADAMAAPQRAQRKSERRSRFALAGPVWTISRPFSTVLPATSASCTALRFAILARWRSASAFDWFAHEFPESAF